MSDSEHFEKIRFNQDETCNGNIPVESITLARDVLGTAQGSSHIATAGCWRYTVRTGNGEWSQEYVSKSYPSLKAAITSIDSQLRPWIRPWVWLIAVVALIYFADRTGWESGNREGIQDGVQNEFESLCGFSPAQEIKLLNEKIPDRGSNVPVGIQEYCLNKLVNEADIPGK